jgi:cobalamin-dependent methionine synthase I
MVATLTSAHHAVLTHEYETGENNRFYGNDHSEKLKRIRVERSDAGNLALIHQQPRDQEQKVKHHKKKATRETSHRIGETFRGGPSF